MREHGTLHIPDIRAQNDFPMLGSVGGLRTLLAVPLRQQGELIGTLAARRTEVRPFTLAQIKLLETFADQAVIAHRERAAVQELKESLEQQTATSEILGVIASSPTDIQPVLDTVAENAARLCEAMMHSIRLVEGDQPRLWRTMDRFRMPSLYSPSAGCLRAERWWTGETIHVHDLAASPKTSSLKAKSRLNSVRLRTILATPLLREGVAIGAIPYSSDGGPSVHREANRASRNLRRPSSDRHRERAVVQGIQERNAELREALEHQTATAEVLSIISRSPTDVQPVLDAIVESAARVCGIDDVVLRLREGNAMVSRAHFGPIPLGRGKSVLMSHNFAGCASMARSTFPTSARRTIFQCWVPSSLRTFLAAPLRQQGELIGGLFARRTEVRPFTPAQIKLLETFADQAVIAIENVRLFQELDERTNELGAPSENSKRSGKWARQSALLLISRLCSAL